MNYEKEPLHISTSVPNGTYEAVSYTHLATEYVAAVPSLITAGPTISHVVALAVL